MKMFNSIAIVALLTIPVSALTADQPPACTSQWASQGEVMDAIDDFQGNILVTDRTHYKVFKYNEFGGLIDEWTGFNNPRGIAVDSQGFVYVCSWNSGEVHKFNPDGSSAGSWVSSNAMYVAVDSNDDVWITSFSDNQVRKFDSSGTLLLEWPVGSVSNPRGIAVDSQGDVYVTEQGANRVRKFDQNGTPIFILGSGFAWDIAVDGNDNVYTATTSAVIKYSSDGTYLTSWLGCDTGANDFEFLAGIGVNSKGDVFVPDFVGRRISVFESTPKLSCSGFEPPMANYPVTAKKNRALPLKAELFDAEGSPVFGSDLTAPPILQVWQEYDTPEADDVSDDALPAGQGTEGNQFVFTDDLKWQFNLKTSNYSGPGTYTVIMESGDPSEYVIDPSCLTEFVVK